MWWYLRTTSQISPLLYMWRYLRTRGRRYYCGDIMYIIAPRQWHIPKHSCGIIARYPFPFLPALLTKKRCLTRNTEYTLGDKVQYHITPLKMSLWRCLFDLLMDVYQNWIEIPCIFKLGYVISAFAHLTQWVFFT